MSVPSTATAAAKPPQLRRAGAHRAVESSSSARRIAGLHKQGDAFRIVVSRVESTGTALTVVESRSVPAGDVAALVAVLASQKIDLLVRVVASSQTIARCVPIPGSGGNGSNNGVEQDRNRLASAVALLAEAELPAMLPAHRRAAGVIRPGPEGPEAHGKKAEAALLTGWSTRSDEAAPPKSGVKGEVFTAEIAALACLTRAVGGAPIALYADQETGAVAMLASGFDDKGAPRIAARVLRADVSSPDAWRASIESSASEIAASVGLGHAQVTVPDSPAALVIQNPSPRRIPGAPSDPTWFSQYGIAFGAVVAASQPDPAVRSLAGLAERAKGDRAGPVEQSLSWMAVPRNAGVVIAVCVLMWFFWPLAVAAARHWALSRNTGGASALQGRLVDAQRRASFYDTLKQRRWPMTKLIADIAGAAPVGVTIDTLDLARDQGLSIRGKADRDELVTTFRKNLTDSSVFTQVATPSIETESSGVSFQLEALVAAPLFPARRAEDFRTNTLAVRLYGPGAAKPGVVIPTGAGESPGSNPPPAAAPAKTEAPAADSARRSRNGRSGRDDASGKSDEPTRRPASGAGEPPPPISDAEIAKLDRTGAMKEWTTRKSASSKADLDPAIKQRLIDEAAKCKARFDEVKNQGGGA